MNINQKTINDLLNEDKIYNIPSYQRDYKWGKEEITTMMEDISKFFEARKNGRDDNYFFGNIIVQKTASGQDDSNKFDYYLIDGQQRLTSFFLLNKAMLEIEFRYDVKEEMDTKLVDLYNSSFKKKKKFFKLLNKNSELEHFIYGDKNIKNQNLVNNYEVIKNSLADLIKTREDLDLLDKSLSYIILGTIEIAESQDAETVFENINSKGKSLSVTELFKNKLLLTNNYLTKKQFLESPEFKNEIENLNNEIEENILSTFDKIESIQSSIETKSGLLKYIKFNSANDFLRLILTNLFQRDIDQDEKKAYKSIKIVVSTIEDLEQLKNLVSKLEDTIYYLEVLESIISQENESSFYAKWVADKSIALVDLLLVAIKQLFDDKILDQNKLNSDFEKLVVSDMKSAFSCLARASILSDNFLGKNLWRSVRNSIAFDEKGKLSWVKTTNNIISPKANDSNEEGNEDIKDIANEKQIYEAIAQFDFFKRDKLLTKYLLLLVERNMQTNINSKELITWKNLYDNATNNQWSIEHIIPQKINPETNDGKVWVADLDGFDYMSVIDKIGNLSVVTIKLNAAMKNYKFNKKKDLFVESKLLINNNIGSQKKFSAVEYKQRSTNLTELINEIIKL